MPLPLNDDLNVIFNVDEFAVLATYRRINALGDSEVRGIFDNETVPVEAGGYAVVHQEQPRLMCRTVDMANIDYGDEFIISSVRYKVVAWIHNGVGETTIHLEKQ